MSHRFRTDRVAIAVACAVALASSGCGMFRAKTGYERSPESRPLEVPPELDRPAQDERMRIPEAPGSTVRGAVGEAPAGSVPSLRIDDTVASTWRRLGLALQRIDGASIEDRSELLNVYTVRYGGESFLLRVQADGDGSRVDAVDSNGAPITGGAAGRLLGLLQRRLG